MIKAIKEWLEYRRNVRITKYNTAKLTAAISVKYDVMFKMIPYIMDDFEKKYMSTTENNGGKKE